MPGMGEEIMGAMKGAEESMGAGEWKYGCLEGGEYEHESRT